MSIVHIRDIAKYGVLCDPDPYTLPNTAWSFGLNVRFRNGKITSGPVFRNVLALGSDPRYSAATAPASGLDLLFTGYLNGTVKRVINAAETDYTLTGYTPVSAEGVWTDTSLAGIVYINRSDRAPWYLRPSDITFQNLGVVAGGPTTWDSTYTCGLLRTCAGALVALNVTKGATNYPTMVKTSSLPLSGAIPASWDITVANSLATENILAEMHGAITDAQKLGSSLVIYGLQESWLMYADSSTSVFNYTKLPYQKGSLNSNCSVEIDGKNYVFGVDDIWVHDGTSELSIIDHQNRDFVFGSLNLAKKNRCFVLHNAQLKELQFNYISGDRGVVFLNAPDGCNRSATYNYADKTWTFDDQPLVFSASNANLSVSATYATTTALYSTTGGSYQDQEDGFKRTPVYVGTANTLYNLSTSMYALDLFGPGSTVAFPVDINATAPRYLERDGIDLDGLSPLGMVSPSDLRAYKVISSIYPQGRFDASAPPLMMSIGAADYFNNTPVFSAYQPYDGNTNYKLDFNIGGRYLFMKLLYSSYIDMTLTGFDIDLLSQGQR
jgi:hypothetical protein